MHVLCPHAPVQAYVRVWGGAVDVEARLTSGLSREPTKEEIRRAKRCEQQRARRQRQRECRVSCAPSSQFSREDIRRAKRCEQQRARRQRQRESAAASLPPFIFE